MFMKNTLRRILGSLALVGLLLCQPVKADVGAATVVLNAVSANTNSAVFDVSKASFVRVQVYSASTSSCIVLINMRANSTAPWFTVATITNPTGGAAGTVGGEYWSVPLTMQIQIQVTTYASGNITAIIETHTISK
jgi:hypothetical protein